MSQVSRSDRIHWRDRKCAEIEAKRRHLRSFQNDLLQLVRSYPSLRRKAEMLGADINKECDALYDEWLDAKYGKTRKLPGF